MNNLLTAVRFSQRLSDLATIITLEFGEHTEIDIHISDVAGNRYKIDTSNLKIALEEVKTELERRTPIPTE